ncbi:MAG TPA: hypothetical protein VFQ45_14100 [Longimicrobium sp.]|nr:hypothetical protein [Longimicrobium sp.]
MARRARWVRLATWGGGGILLGLALLVLLANVIARTEAGHEFVLERTLEALGRDIQGELKVARIDGNLFEGARLYGVRLEDEQKRPFIVADSAFLDYDVVTLISPRIRITRLTLFDPEIYVSKLPGDSLYNYQRIFAKKTPRTGGARVERATLLDTVNIRNGFVQVELAWQPDTTLSRAEQRRELALALSDTGTIVVRRVPSGYVRTMSFRAMNGRMRDIRFAPGSKTGTRLHIDTLGASMQVFRRPARLVHLRGDVSLTRAHLEFDMPVLRFPSSLISASGVMRTDSFPEWFDKAEGQMYDIAFRSDSVAFRDLQWLYPRFPANAAGALSLRIETRPEGTLFLARDARLRAPGTLITGSFGMIAGDTLRFVDVDLEAEPVDVGLIDRMLPEGLPVRGLRLGGAEIRGGP